MEKKIFKKLVWGAALATGLGVATERGCDTQIPKPKAEQVSRPKTEVKPASNQDNQSVDYHKKVDTPKQAENETVYDQRIIDVIRQLFPNIEIITTGDSSIYTRIHIGDLYLAKTTGLYGVTYSLERWTGYEQINPDKNYYFNYTADILVNIKPDEDENFTLGLDSNSERDVSCDKNTLSDAISEYIKYSEYINNTRINESSYDNTYEELESLIDYYTQRITSLEKLLDKEWKFLINDEKYKERVKRHITDATLRLEELLKKINRDSQDPSPSPEPEPPPQ